MVERKYLPSDRILQGKVVCEPPSTTQVILAWLYVLICLGLIATVLGAVILR